MGATSRVIPGCANSPASDRHRCDSWETEIERAAQGCSRVHSKAKIPFASVAVMVRSPTWQHNANGASPFFAGSFNHLRHLPPSKGTAWLSSLPPPKTFSWARTGPTARGQSDVAFLKTVQNSQGHVRPHQHDPLKNRRWRTPAPLSRPALLAVFVADDGARLTVLSTP